MTAPASPASAFAAELLLEFVRLGVRDVVVCPGSRSQALALAAAEAESAGAVRLHVRTDERSAGFFALGVARETGVPAPVIVTSGTAVANLHPAAFEAHEGRVPLILLTCDRPAELRGRRSNQTTRQAGLFEGFARLALDVPAPSASSESSSSAPASSAQASSTVDPVATPEALARRAFAAARGAHLGEPAGPVQLNLAFREPLSGETGFARPLAELFSEAAAERASASHGVRESHASGSTSDGSGAARVVATDTGYRTEFDASAAGPNGAAAGLDSYVHSGDALTVVIAGEDACGSTGEAAETFAREAGLPLLAEVVSGARFGRETITSYASLIDAPDVGALTERAIVFGHPTLTRQVPALLQRDDVEVIVVDPHVGERAEHYDPSGRARVVQSIGIDPGYDPAGMHRWLGAWVVADRRLREQRSTGESAEPKLDRDADYKRQSEYARAEVAARREPATREMLVEGAWRATWPHDRLVLAASRLVRVLDGLAPARRIRVHANRGLAGIDGTVATALGVAAASQGDGDLAHAAGVTRVVIGDLALLHDAGSLLLPEGEPRPRVQLLVGNDGGGTIFDTLEARGTADAAAFDRVMYTPQRVDLAQLAAAYGWGYARAENRGELDAVFTTPVAGPMLVEVPLAR